MESSTSIYDDLFITRSEYEYFTELDPSDKLFYFTGIYQSQLDRNLGGDRLESLAEGMLNFFKDLNDEEQLKDITPPPNDLFNELSSSELPHVKIQIDDDYIILESNSLKAVRSIRDNFMEDGYLLRRNKSMEKGFKANKVTRYVRIFSVIDRIAPICLN